MYSITSSTIPQVNILKFVLVEYFQDFEIFVDLTKQEIQEPKDKKKKKEEYSSKKRIYRKDMTNSKQKKEILDLMHRLKNKVKYYKIVPS